MRDEREFTEFAAARSPHLYRSALLLCGDRHLAEDLVQETLAKVYVRMHRRIGRIDNPAGYAHTALVRTFISSRRRRSAGEVAVAHVPDSGGTTVDADLRLTLAAALAELAPLDRAVLVLRYLDDRSVAEVAATLSVSEGAVRNRSMRAIGRLRDHLGTGELLHS